MNGPVVRELYGREKNIYTYIHIYIHTSPRKTTFQCLLFFILFMGFRSASFSTRIQGMEGVELIVAKTTNIALGRDHVDKNSHFPSTSILSELHCSIN